MSHFNYPLRIYYEDTDAAGVVYYANYLKFMERARSEALRHIGFTQSQLAQDGFLFVVHSCQIRYLLPAKLDDELIISSFISNIKRSSLIFNQQVKKNEQLLTNGEFVIACVSTTNFKPCSLPPNLTAKLSSYNLSS